MHIKQGELHKLYVFKVTQAAKGQTQISPHGSGNNDEGFLFQKPSYPSGLQKISDVKTKKKKTAMCYTYIEQRLSGPLVTTQKKMIASDRMTKSMKYHNMHIMLDIANSRK